jgi:hypothetical protein
VNVTTDGSIRVEFGNSSGRSGHGAPVVTYLHIPSTYTFDPTGHSPSDVAMHLLRNPGVTNLPNLEAVLVAAHPREGTWGHHGAGKPDWIASNNDTYGQFLAELYQTRYQSLHSDGFHRWKEDTHHTLYGSPGVGPWAQGQQMLKINSGNDIQAALLGGGQVDFTGQASAATATTLTTGATFTTNQWAGCRVYASVSATQMVWGLVVSNTNAASASVLTVDRWYTAATPGGTAGSTPSSTATYVIVGAGGPAAWFMGLTATGTAPAGTDTSLTGEITSQPAGLVRKICPYAHTAGTNSYTLTPVFTIGGGDTSLPITVAQIGVFNSMVVTNTTSTMLFRTLLSSAATLAVAGDQLTVTETVTM